jgi:predicted anti-sigma-YlaC factor YlaD
MGTQELTCKELVELITEYLEGTILSADKARFEAHLILCTACRIYLDQMRATIHTLGRLGEESISPEAKNNLLRAFRTWKT